MTDPHTDRRSPRRRLGAFAFLGFSTALALLLVLTVMSTASVAEALQAPPAEDASTAGGFQPLEPDGFGAFLWWSVLWGVVFGGLLLWPFAYFGLRDTRLARTAAILLPTSLVVAVAGTLLAGPVVFPMLALVLIMEIAVCSAIGWTRRPERTAS